MRRIPDTVKLARKAANEIMRVLRAVSGRTDLECTVSTEQLLVQRLAQYSPQTLERISSVMTADEATLVKTVLEEHSWHSKAAIFKMADRQEIVSVKNQEPANAENRLERWKEGKSGGRKGEAVQDVKQKEMGVVLSDVLKLINRLPDPAKPLVETADVSIILHRIGQLSGNHGDAQKASRLLANHVSRLSSCSLQQLGSQLATAEVLALRSLLEDSGWHSKAALLKQSPKEKDSAVAPETTEEHFHREEKEASHVVSTELRITGFPAEYDENSVLKFLSDRSVVGDDVHFTDLKESSRGVCVSFVSYELARASQSALHGAMAGEKRLRVSLFRTKLPVANAIPASEESTPSSTLASRRTSTCSSRSAENGLYQHPQQPSSPVTCVCLGVIPKENVKTFCSCLEKRIEDFREDIVGFHRYGIKAFDIAFVELTSASAASRLTVAINSSPVNGRELEAYVANRYRVFGARDAFVRCTKVWVRGPKLLENLDKVFTKHTPSIFAIEVPLPCRGYAYFMFRSHTAAQTAVRQSMHTVRALNMTFNVQATSVDIFSSGSLSGLCQEKSESPFAGDATSSECVSADCQLQDLRQLRTVQVCVVGDVSRHVLLSYCELLGEVESISIVSQNRGRGEWRADVVFVSRKAAEIACSQLPEQLKSVQSATLHFIQNGHGGADEEEILGEDLGSASDRHGETLEANPLTEYVEGNTHVILSFHFCGSFVLCLCASTPKAQCVGKSL